MQVADALADKYLPEWARVLAQRVAATSWDTPESCEDIHCALLSLPHPIRHAVMQALVSLQPPGEALLTLPHTLHSSLTAALISPAGTLCQSLYRPPALQILLTHLPTLPAAGQPALRSLDLSKSSMSPSSCHLLGQTLSSHTRLTALLLHLTDSGAVTLGCVEALTSVLPFTSALRELSLSHMDLTESAMQHLTKTLPSLPHLISLTLATITPSLCTKAALPSDSSPPAAQRPEDPKRPLLLFMHAVACHPAVTHLSLCARDVSLSNSHLPHCFPNLRCLDLELRFADAPATRAGPPAPSSLTHGSATLVQFPALTRLALRLHAPSTSTRWTASAVQRMLPLHAESAACPQMQSLSLSVQTHGSDECEQAIWNALAGTTPPPPLSTPSDIGS